MGGPSFSGMVQALPFCKSPHMGMRSHDLHGNMHAVSTGSTSALLRQRSQAAAPACRGARTAIKSTICSQRLECSVWQRAAGQRCWTVCRAAPGNTDAGAMSGFFNMLGQMMQQGQASEAPPSGAELGVNNMTYHPPGTPAPLLNDISMQLPANSMGLIYGSSGSGKTTLLKIIGGLAQQDSGVVGIGSGALGLHAAGTSSNGSNGSNKPGHTAAAAPVNSSSNGSAPGRGGSGGSAAAARTAQTGLVFQFPERHFLGSTVGEELTFGWPQRPEDMFTRQQMAQRLNRVLQAVGLTHISMHAPPSSLSDGYKRRLALAVQLARGPAVLLLDEPLAGLDWRARADIADLLGKLKQECTIVVVSHDLRELSQQVDTAWEMLPGGRLQHRPNWRDAM